jgi:heme A synthase
VDDPRIPADLGIAQIGNAAILRIPEMNGVQASAELQQGTIKWAQQMVLVEMIHQLWAIMVLVLVRGGFFRRDHSPVPHRRKMMWKVSFYELAPFFQL